MYTDVYTQTHALFVHALIAYSLFAHFVNLIFMFISYFVFFWHFVFVESSPYHVYYHFSANMFPLLQSACVSNRERNHGFTLISFIVEFFFSCFN